ncbi:MAG: outer membrane protein assembly factor BamD [Myxococcota bacterium]
MRTVRIAVATLVCCALAGCQTDDALFEEVPPAEELWAQGEEELEGFSVLGFFDYVDYQAAIDTFQSIVDNYPSSTYAVQAELKIADAYFADDKFEEALSYYRDFGDLHPDHPQVPYTIWRSALCHERRRLEPSRDQGATRDALVFLDRLLMQYPFSEYAVEAEVLWRELQTVLAENVEVIADFYFERGEYEASAERYRALLNEYPGLGLDPRVLYKLGACYAELRRVDEADRIFRTVVTHYGESEYAFLARERLATNLP